MLHVLALLLGSWVASLRGAPSVDHTLRFVFQNRHEALDLALLDPKGAVAPTALAELSHFVRCFRTDGERPIHPRLAEIVARTAEAFHDKRIEVISGYRAAPFGAPHSKHFVGHAMDVKLTGVSGKKVAAWVWHNFRGVGVGWYPNQGFVHIDVRDTDVSWIDTAQHGEGGSVRYFARPTNDHLPKNAPTLDYDRTGGAPIPLVASKDEIGISGGY